MGYYIRILGRNVDNVPLHQLQDLARPAVLDAESNGDAWEQINITHASGQAIASVEKNLVVEGQLGADELKEFIEEVAHYKPDSASQWLREFLPTVKVIYAFQLLNGTDVDDGWELLHRVYTTIWRQAGGILQADCEGFSDEDGFTILWQFGEGVTGKWNMGVLQDGLGKHFAMDL